MRLAIAFLLALCCSAQAQIYRPMLTSIATYHVAVVCGSTFCSDANDCLSEVTSCRTMPGVRTKLYQIDLGNFGALVLVHSVDSTIQPLKLWAPWVGGNPLNGPSGFGSPVTFRGDPITPSNVTLTVVDDTVIAVSNHANVNIEGFKFVVTGTLGGGGLYASAYGTINISGAVDFGSMPGDHMLVNPFGFITCGHNYYVSGPARSHFRMAAGGNIECPNTYLFFSNAPAFSHSFAWGDMGGILNSKGANYSNGGSTVTGKTYDVTMNAILDSGGAGFPGTGAGTTATGGQFH